MKYACAFLVIMNLLAVYYITRYIVAHRMSDAHYISIQSIVIINAASIVLYSNFIGGEMNMKQYAFFVVTALATIYSVTDLAKKLMSPTSKRSEIYSDREKIAVSVTTKDRILSIIVYFVSASACFMFYRTIRES